MNRTFDVIILGAGPAGSACAMALEGKGLKVALIDKATFPRDKVCGDAIPGQSFKALRLINPKWELQLRDQCEQTQVHSSRCYISQNKYFSYKWISYASNSKRIHFDYFLFNIVKEQTNTEIFQNKKVNNLTISQTSVNCILEDGLELSAQIIVGCDGNHSIVKRSFLQQQKQKNEVYAAVRAYYKGISGVTAGLNEFHLVKEVDGYFWIFPLPDDYCNIGFGIINDKKKQTDSRIDIRKKITQIIESDRFKARFKNAKLDGNINGFGLPIWTKNQRISGERFMLAGDAASLVDPIQGHGIDKAIWSGMIAANQIQRCFQQNNFQSDFMKGYEKEFNQKFASELKRSYLLMKFLTKYPIVLEWLIYFPYSQRFTIWIIKSLKI
jgi:geranylgeranyl reductase family protein